jgi:hypothetical protein
MPNNPVQVILNTKDYFISPDPGRYGPAKDFFENRDKEFVDHRDRLARQVSAISASIQQSGLTAGVVKVNLQREAWAKSNRPHRALFPPEKASVHRRIDDWRTILSCDCGRCRRTSK